VEKIQKVGKGGEGRYMETEPVGPERQPEQKHNECNYKKN
jgi:hypothetical protein